MIPKHPHQMYELKALFGRRCVQWFSLSMRTWNLLEYSISIDIQLMAVVSRIFYSSHFNTRQISVLRNFEWLPSTIYIAPSQIRLALESIVRMFKRNLRVFRLCFRCFKRSYYYCSIQTSVSNPRFIRVVQYLTIISLWNSESTNKKKLAFSRRPVKYIWNACLRMECIYITIYNDEILLDQWKEDAQYANYTIILILSNEHYKCEGVIHLHIMLMLHILWIFEHRTCFFWLYYISSSTLLLYHCYLSSDIWYTHYWTTIQVVKHKIRQLSDCTFIILYIRYERSWANANLIM